MYDVLLPSNCYFFKFDHKITFVLQNASGKQFFYFEMDKYTKKHTCEPMFMIREHNKPEKSSYSPAVIGFACIPAKNWFIINKNKHIGIPKTIFTWEWN